MWKCIHLLSLTNAYVEPKLLSECRMWPSPQKVALYPLLVGPHPPGSQAVVYFQSWESALRSHRRLSLSKTVLMLVRAVAWVPSFCGRVVLSLTALWPLALLCGCAPGLVSHFGCYANILVQILLRHVFMSLRELHLGVELVSCEVGVFSSLRNCQNFSQSDHTVLHHTSACDVWLLLLLTNVCSSVCHFYHACGCSVVSWWF